MKKGLALGLSGLMVIVVCAIAAAGTGIYFWRHRSRPSPWITQPAKRGDVQQVVSATGTLQPLVLSPVGSQVSGIVWKLHADYNDPVKKGQVLVELDPALFKSAVASQEANVASAEAAVRKAQAALENAHLAATRAVALAQKHYIAEADRDTAVAQERQAEADLNAARAQVKQSQAALEKSRLDLKNSVILSPVDGVVIARNVELGQAVVSSFQAPNIYTIAQDLRQMEVLANVDEADVGMVKEGQSATFTVDAFRNRRFSAKVSQVRNAAQTVQNVVTYVVVLSVDNSDLLLRPGMTANVRIEVAQRQGALLVPNAALRFKPRVDADKGGEGGEHKPGEGGEHRGGGGKGPGGKDKDKSLMAGFGTVYVLDGNAPRAVRVVTGITDGTQTEVLRGLEEGETVIVDAARAGGPAGPSGSSNPLLPSRPPMGGGRRGF